MDTMAIILQYLNQLQYINVLSVGHLKFTQCYMANIFQLKSEFINKVLLTHSCAHSFTYYLGLLLHYEAELSHRNRDCLALRAENISCLALSRCLQTPALRSQRPECYLMLTRGFLGCFLVGTAKRWVGVGVGGE